MPRLFEIKSPSGRTFEISAPDNATQEEIDAEIARVQASVGEETDDGTSFGMSAVGSMARGAGQSFGSLIEGVGDITGAGGSVNNAQQLGRDIKDQFDVQNPVNPSLESNFLIKGAGVVGQVAEQAADVAHDQPHRLDERREYGKEDTDDEGEGSRQVGGDEG